jgi:hypothetical protein
MALTRRVAPVDRRMASGVRPQVARALARNSMSTHAARTAVASRLSGAMMAGGGRQPTAAGTLRERTNAGCAVRFARLDTLAMAEPNGPDGRRPRGSYQVAALSQAAAQQIDLQPSAGDDLASMETSAKRLAERAMG